MALHHILDDAVGKRSKHPAVIEGNGKGQVDYEWLGRISDQVRDRLKSMGVERGDRIGIYLRKSIEGVASIFGILKCGAAYVPVDPTAPASRNAYIHYNCGVKVVIVEKQFVKAFLEELAKFGHIPQFLILGDTGGGGYLESALNSLDAKSPAPSTESAHSSPDDLAYILYTSGSTGKPKGVMLSHRNAVSFVDWCSETFVPSSSDIFSSHAPFHFDLSIFDIYLPLKHGASLVLVPEEVGKEPQGLAKLVSDFRITVWYSVPSILNLLSQFAKNLEKDFSRLRLVLFAGEVFPVSQLRILMRRVPNPRYFNLYGPTETNVCTWFEIPSTIPDDRVDPFPIGKTCSNLESIVVGEDGRTVPHGAEGELCISGPNVMQGYWSLHDLTEKGFLQDDGTGKRWYKTGDIVVEEPDGNYRYLGRRDRMVKKLGYRIELGEIESCIHQHEAIREVAVIAISDDTGNIRVIAHLSTKEGKRPSLIELKIFCSQHLPVYMIPDAFTFHNALPKTSTDKTDYQKLRKMK